MRVIIFDEYGTKLTVMRENSVITGEFVVMGDFGILELNVQDSDDHELAVSFYLSAEQREELIRALEGTR